MVHNSAKYFSDKEKLAADLLLMLGKGSSNDVKIVLLDGEIVANKDVLSARSEYFSKMFSNQGFIECTNREVSILDCKKIIMENIIQYLFGGNLKLDELDVIELLLLSNQSRMMCLSDISKAVEHYLSEYLVTERFYLPHERVKLLEGILLANHLRLHGVMSSFIIAIQNMLHLINSHDCDVEKLWKIPEDLMKYIVAGRDFFCPPQYQDGRGGCGKFSVFFHEGDNKFTCCNCAGQIVLSCTDNGEYQFAVHGLFRASHIQRFRALVSWHTNNKDICDESTLASMLQSFDLRKFTSDEIIFDVRRSGLYSDSVVDKRLKNIIDELRNLIQERDIMLEHFNAWGNILHD